MNIETRIESDMNKQDRKDLYDRARSRLRQNIKASHTDVNPSPRAEAETRFWIRGLQLVERGGPVTLQDARAWLKELDGNYLEEENETD